MVSARHVSTVYDNVVTSPERPLGTLARLDREVRDKLSELAVTVGVLAETSELGVATRTMLSELGIDAPARGESLNAADLDHGLLVIVGDHFAPEFLTNVLTGPWTARLDRVVLFGNRIGTRTLAALDDLGFPFIVKSLPTPERLSSMLAAADPTTVALRQAVQAQRAACSAIEEGSGRLLGHIRTGNLGAAIAEARRAFTQFETLLDSAAATHWLSLIRQYHDGTAQHCSLVSAIAMLFARGLGFSSGDQRRLFEAAHFHDVGKVRIPLSVLDKPGPLDANERFIMETHAREGFEILARHPDLAGEVAEVAYAHHELLDGSGYPRRIGGQEIGDVTRIVTICDIFAALMERRPYKQPKTARQAYDILQSMDGKLDATLLRAFADIAESCSSD